MRGCASPHQAQRYDAIADWYEEEFLAEGDAGGLVAQIREALGRHLGTGSGTCLDIGCGTGVYSSEIVRLGYSVIGVDPSQGMLRHARSRLLSLCASGTQLPVATSTVDAAVSIMTHTDIPGYGDLLQEAERVLAPDGRFVHIGVHPCFCGPFADRTEASAIVLSEGYLIEGWSTDSHTDKGVRDKVGAFHIQMSSLLNACASAGLLLQTTFEIGSPTPIVFGFVGLKRA